MTLLDRVLLSRDGYNRFVLGVISNLELLAWLRAGT